MTSETWESLHPLRRLPLMLYSKNFAYIHSTQVRLMNASMPVQVLLAALVP